MDRFLIQLIEHNDVVHTVQKLRSKCLVQCFLDNAAGEVLIWLASSLRTETDTTAEVFQLACTDIRRHDQNCILKVDPSAKTVSQTTFVQDLQQQVEHVRMRFLDLIQQDNRVGLTADLLGQLTALFITYISRRRTDQAGHRKLFEILAHIDTDQSVGRVKQIFRQLFGQMSLTDTCRP